MKERHQTLCTCAVIFLVFPFCILQRIETGPWVLLGYSISAKTGATIFPCDNEDVLWARTDTAPWFNAVPGSPCSKVDIDWAKAGAMADKNSKNNK